MKTLLHTGILILGIMMYANQSNAQGSTCWDNYDRVWNSTTLSSESATNGVYDPAGNLYIAGYQSGANGGGVRIVKHNSNNPSSISYNFNPSTNNNRDEPVAMFWGTNSQLYVVVKSIASSPIGTYTTVLRFNSSLSLLNLSPSTFPIEATQAVMDGSNNLYLTGMSYITPLASVKVYKLNSALVTLYTGNYNYQSSTGQQALEKPKAIFLNPNGTSLYICGSAEDTISKISAGFVAKFSSTLFNTWSYRTNLSVHATSFNALRLYNNVVYACGTANSTRSLRLSRISESTGALLNQAVWTNTGYTTEGLFIPNIDATGMYVVCSAKSDSLNQYRIIFRRFNITTLGSGSTYYQETFLGASQIMDVNHASATNGNKYVFISGRRKINSTPTNPLTQMFIRELTYNGSQLLNTRTDNVSSRTAGGAKVILQSNNYPTVIGYTDNNSGIATIQDLQMHVWIYQACIWRVSDGQQNSDTETENQLSAYPNPAREFITIESKNPIRTIRVADISGKVVLQRNYDGELYRDELPFSDLAPGLYIILVNESKSTKIIKY
jgi:hypothetical protein